MSMDIMPMTISQTNSAPAIGAWNTAAIAPAAEHATSRRRRGVDMFSRLPAIEANTAAVWTSGPSRPIEAPEPIVTIAAALRRRFARTGM